MVILLSGITFFRVAKMAFPVCVNSPVFAGVLSRTKKQGMKKIVGLIAALLILTIAQAGGIDGKGHITGKILTADERAAPMVTVMLAKSGNSAITDANGLFTLRNVPSGTHELVISLVGYETVRETVVVEDDKTATVEIRLSLSDKQLEEVVVRSRLSSYTAKQTSTSLRLNEPLLEVPQNIQVVTSKVLADQQVISMSDNLIRNVSGATRLEHWGDMYTNISMRGSQIQAFRNGFNVVNSYWGPLTEDMSFVDHIEFVKGPSGFMLANGDPSGLYNVVTKKPTGQTKGEANFTVGSFGLYRVSADLDGKLSKDGKLLYRLNLAGQQKGSHRPYESNDRYSIAPVISYKISDKTTLTAEYVYQAARMTDVGSYYAFSTEGYATLPVDYTSTNPGLPRTRIDDHTVTINLQHQFNENWKLTAQAARYSYNMKGSSMWLDSISPTGNGDVIRSVGIWDAKSPMGLAQAFVNGKLQTGGITHRILGGVDLGTKNYYADYAQSYAIDAATQPFNVYAPTYGVPSNGYPVYDRSLNIEARALAGFGVIDQQYTGLYLQDELGFFNNKLRLTLAGRYTTVTQSGFGAAQSANRITPRIGLSYSVDANTSVYAVYDQAFLPQSGVRSDGNKVQPITGGNREIGIKRDWFDGRWNSTVSAYRIVKNNELTGDPSAPLNSGLSIELGQKIAEGIELDIRGTLARGLMLTANYAYTNAEISKVTDAQTGYSVGDVVPGYAKHVANAWLSYGVQGGSLKGLGINGGFSFQGDRALQTFSKTDTRFNLPDYFRLDGGLFWENDKVRLNLNAFNLLDKYLYSGGSYTFNTVETVQAYYWQSEAPRNFRFSVGVKF